MANLYGVNAMNLLVDVPPTKARAGEQHARVRCIFDEFTFTADSASGDIIKMGGLIPVGARILDVHVGFNSLDASGGTVDVGWEASADGTEVADPDGFADNLDVTTADVFKMSDDLANGAGQTKKFTAAVQAAITTDGDLDTTTGRIWMAIYYIVD